MRLKNGNNNIIMELYNAFTELFSSDIINILLLYSDNALVIQLQDYFPKLLKHIKLSAKELVGVHKNNWQYITKRMN